MKLYEMSCKMELEDCNIIKEMLSEAGIHNYEPEVLTHLSDYVDHYIDEIVENSKNYMQHAGRKELDVSDVKLALSETRKQETKCRPTWDVRIDYIQSCY